MLGACAWRQIIIPRNGLHCFFTSLPPERDLLEAWPHPSFCPDRGPGSQNQESEEHWVQALGRASGAMRPQSPVCTFWAQKPHFVKLGPSSSATRGSMYPTCHCMRLWPRDSQHLDQASWGPFPAAHSNSRVETGLKPAVRRFWPPLCYQAKDEVQVGQGRPSSWRQPQCPRA